MTRGKAHEPVVTMDLFLARPGSGRQHVVRDPQGEPRIIFGEDDGTRINDRLARYLIASLNAGLYPEDPNPDEGWFLDSAGNGDEQDQAILICDPDFEVRLEILETGSLEDDQVLGRNVTALINTYFLQDESSHPSVSSSGSRTEGSHPSPDSECLGAGRACVRSAKSP